MAKFSFYPDLEQETRRLKGKIPLAWVSGDKARIGNFGDSLSAVVVSTISGRRVERSSFDSTTSRLAAIGTIAHGMRHGVAHLWGTGLDATRRAFGNRDTAFALAPNTQYVVHATRGPNTRQLLLDSELHAPPIYGDPGWFLPRILNPSVEKTVELGVIPHISGLAAKSVDAGPKADRVRMHVSGTDGVKLIPTYHDASWEGFKSKLEEILACKRIVSTSFHGLLLADAYQIPCLYFPPRPTSGAVQLSLEDRSMGVDHRFADFYKGVGRKFVPAFGHPTSQQTPWDQVIKAVDAMYEPLENPGAATLLEAFPFHRVVNYSDDVWPVNEADMQALPW